MKKIIIVAALLISGCAKEDINKQSSTCGLIVSDNVNDYSVTIRNSQSGNLKTFVLYEGDWMNAHPGSNFCISNTTPW
jgi:hypothetical protein